MDNPLADKILVALVKSKHLIVTSDYALFAVDGVFLYPPVKQYRVTKKGNDVLNGMTSTKVFIPFTNIRSIGGLTTENYDG